LGTNNEEFLFYLGANGFVNKKTSPIKGEDFRVSKEYRENAFSNNHLEDYYALVKLENRV
jgi:hypothetical protein